VVVITVYLWLKTINSVQTPIDIVNSGGKYSGGTTGNPHITINNFQSSDAGIYVCVNVAGIKRHSSNYNLRLEVNTTLTRLTNKLV
jgi:hypothetical protein